MEPGEGVAAQRRALGSDDAVAEDGQGLLDPPERGEGRAETVEREGLAQGVAAVGVGRPEALRRVPQRHLRFREAAALEVEGPLGRPGDGRGPRPPRARAERGDPRIDLRGRPVAAERRLEEEEVHVERSGRAHVAELAPRRCVRSHGEGGVARAGGAGPGLGGQGRGGPRIARVPAQGRAQEEDLGGLGDGVLRVEERRGEDGLGLGGAPGGDEAEGLPAPGAGAGRGAGWPGDCGRGPEGLLDPGELAERHLHVPHGLDEVAARRGRAAGGLEDLERLAVGREGLPRTAAGLGAAPGREQVGQRGAGLAPGPVVEGERLGQGLRAGRPGGGLEGPGRRPVERHATLGVQPLVDCLAGQRVVEVVAAPVLVEEGGPGGTGRRRRGGRGR